MAQFINEARNAAGQQRLQHQTAREEAEWSDRATQRQWEEKKFPSYDPRRGNVYDTELVDQAHFSTGYHGHQFGEVWVYIRAHGPYSVLEYAVVNPRTGHLLTFTPEAALDAPSRVYLPEDMQVRGVAAGTGVAGGYLERGFYGLALGVIAAPYAAAGVMAASETAAGGVLVTAFRSVGTQMVKQFTWSTFRTKVTTDLFVQGASGTVKNGSDWQKTVGEINYTGALVAWLLPGSSWSAAARNSVLKATFKTNITVGKNWEPHLNIKFPHLTTMEGFAKYLTDVGTDMIASMVKAKLVTGATPAARWLAQSMQRTGTGLGQWIATNRVTLGTLGTIGTSVETKVLKDQEKERITKRIEKHLIPSSTKGQ